MDKLARAFDFRHACKVFDETKKITKNDLDYILEAGRKSPSSFGMEPWHFVVVSNDKLKQQLAPICYNQPQINSCSHFVIALYRKSEQFTMRSEYLRSTIERKLPINSDTTAVDTACQYFINFYSNELAQELSVNHWSEMQCYLPCANMMTAAAYRGIDSCAIGGFHYDNMTKILEKIMPQFSKNSFGVALCLAFGYRKNQNKPKKIRWPLEKIVTILD